MSTFIFILFQRNTYHAIIHILSVEFSLNIHGFGNILLPGGNSIWKHNQLQLLQFHAEEEKKTSIRIY